MQDNTELVFHPQKETVVGIYFQINLALTKQLNVPHCSVQVVCYAEMTAAGFFLN